MAYNEIITRTEAAALIPDTVLPDIMRGVTEESVAFRLFRRLPDMTAGTLRMPVLSALPTAYFVGGDTGLKKTTDQRWTAKTIVAEELAAIVPIPQAVLDDAGYPIWDEVRPRLVEAIAKAVDDAIFLGVNAPGTWPTAIKAAATAAGNAVAIGADPYASLMGTGGVLAKLEDDGYFETGFAGSPSVRGVLRNIRTTDGMPIFTAGMQAGQTYFLAGSPITFARWDSFRAATSDVYIFAGDWSQFVYSVRRDITFSLSTEAVITDSTGAVMFNLFQQNMAALKVSFRCGWQVANPINRLGGGGASQYPVAIWTT